MNRAIINISVRQRPDLLNVQPGLTGNSQVDPSPSRRQTADNGILRRSQPVFEHSAEWVNRKVHGITGWKYDIHAKHTEDSLWQYNVDIISPAGKTSAIIINTEKDPPAITYLPADQNKFKYNYLSDSITPVRLNKSADTAETLQKPTRNSESSGTVESPVHTLKLERDGLKSRFFEQEKALEEAYQHATQRLRDEILPTHMAWVHDHQFHQFKTARSQRLLELAAVIQILNYVTKSNAPLEQSQKSGSENTREHILPENLLSLHKLCLEARKRILDMEVGEILNEEYRKLESRERPLRSPSEGESRRVES